MEQELKELLWKYISENNPELMYELQERYGTTSYLEGKVAPVMEQAHTLLDGGTPWVTVKETLLRQLTEDLRPSRFNYIKEVLEAEFPIEYEALRQTAVLTFEVINMMEGCAPLFEAFDFSEGTEDNRKLRHAIIGEIHDYLL